MRRRFQPKKGSFVERYLARKKYRGWLAEFIPSLFARRLEFVSRFGEAQTLRLSEGLGLKVEPWMADFSFTHSAYFGPVLRLSVRPMGEFKGKELLQEYEHIKDFDPRQKGCIGFISLNFARCGKEKKYTAFIQGFQNRHPFQKLPRATRRRFRHWDDLVLSFLEGKLKAMGAKRIAFLTAEDPLLSNLPKGVRDKFYVELPKSHGFKPKKLTVRMVDYYKHLLQPGQPPKYEMVNEEMKYQVKELD